MTEYSDQIIRIFEGYNISIIKEIDMEKDVTHCYFKANDIGRVLGLTNIRSSIQNFDDDEKLLYKFSTNGGTQNMLFLSSSGVYRLLYASNKPMAKVFRKWVNSVIDDILFNNAKHTKKILEEQEKIINEMKEKFKLLTNGDYRLYNDSLSNVRFNQRLDKNTAIYVAANKVEHENNIYKIGKSINMKNRLNSLKAGSSPSNNFKMFKTYETIANMELATEKYIHALMNSLHIEDDSNTEYFIGHLDVIDLVIKNTIDNQFKSINIINEYISILEKYDFNSEKITSDIINKFVSTYLNNTSDEEIIKNELEEIKEEESDPAEGKQKEIKEKELDDGQEEIKEEESEDDDQEEDYRSCNTCFVTKHIDDFGVNHKYKDSKSKRCRACSKAIKSGNTKDLEKFKCEICEKELLPSTNLKKHQATKSCLAVAADKYNNHIEEPIKPPKEVDTMECYKCKKSHDRTLYFKSPDVDQLIKTCFKCFDEEQGELYKHCNRCDTTKLFDDFPNDSTQSTGKKAACKICNNAARKSTGETAICEFCSREVSVKNLSRHQKTAACQAARAST